MDLNSIFGRFRKNRTTNDQSATMDPPNEMHVPLTPETSAPIIYSDTGASEYETRRFQTTVMGNLSEPPLEWLPILFGLGGFIACVSAAFTSGHFIVWAIAALLIVLASGITRVPTVHCGLLYFLGRRHKIGFWEGYVWIPRMLGARLKILSVERFSHDVPRETSWTNDKWSAVYDVIVNFGVKHVDERPLLQNFFWFFHAWFETETYEEAISAKKDVGTGLFDFMLNADVEAVVLLMSAKAREIARELIQQHTLAELLNFTRETASTEHAALSKELEELAQNSLNPELVGLGIRVHSISFADVDVDVQAKEALQKTQIAPLLAKAEAASYEELMAIAKTLELDPSQKATVLRMQIIKAFAAAADSGLLGTLLQGQIGQLLESISGSESGSKEIV